MLSTAINVRHILGNSARRARGLRAFFAHANFKRADVQHIRLGTKLWHATEAVKDENVVSLLARRDVVKKAPQEFVSRNLEYTRIGPTSQRRRVALRIGDLRKKIGSKETRKMLKKVGVDFKRRGEYQGLNAADVKDLTNFRRRKLK